MTVDRWSPVGARRFDWERALRGSELSSVAKHVGLTIATYDDADGTNLRPGAALLVEATSTSESSVRRGLRALVEAGFLIRVMGGRKTPGRSRDQADEYRLSLPSTGGRSDYQSQGLPVTQDTDWCSESAPTGGHPDYPPEPDQIKTSLAAPTETIDDAPSEHREAVVALLARHPGQVSAGQAIRCAADVARRNKPRDLAKYVRALPLVDVLDRADRAPTKVAKTAAEKCPHNVTGGARIVGVGEMASRVCGACEAAESAQAAVVVTVVARDEPGSEQAEGVTVQ